MYIQYLANPKKNALKFLIHAFPQQVI